MNANNIYPKKYATGEDLKGKPTTLTIDEVRIEMMRPHKTADETPKAVIYFQKATKGIIAGRTLLNEIIKIMGNPETDTWQGKRITLYPTPVKVAGVDRIQIHAKAPINGDSPIPETLAEEEE